MLTKKENREDLCPGHIISGNPGLEGGVCTDTQHARILFSTKDLLDHCLHHCSHTKDCKSDTKRKLFTLFSQKKSETNNSNHVISF